MFETKNNRSKTRAMATRDPGTARLRNDQAILMVTASEGDANMLYAVGFLCPTRLFFFSTRKPSYVVMSDLEIDRAKKQAHVDRVLSLSAYQSKLRKLGKAPAAMIDILDLLFRERGIRRFDRAGKFLRAADRPTARQGLQRANQTRSVLAGARGERPHRSRADHRVSTGGAARAGSRHPHAQAHAGPSATAISI